ncbi:hypothetical protein [Jatrophihabitans sp.]|uniref:hypothetical protein n=1 Tax=Jatrophihabitans sp. TaxID=1932789 RepID=UPI0030C746BB|nr:hypothetical protein [Jatrophihabitans sp.]
MNLSFDDLQSICTWARSDWPRLAQQWLERGYDSPELRTLADLVDSTRAEVAVSVMPSVLRSLGIEVADEGFSEYEASGFGARCRAAFAVVQADLDRTGFGRFQMSPYVTTAGSWITAYAQTSDGRRWTNDGLGITSYTNATQIVASAASLVCDTLLLCKRVRWPRCAAHQTKYLVSRYPSWRGDHLVPADPDGEWWCNSDEPHPVNRLGNLQAADVVPDTGSPTVGR